MKPFALFPVLIIFAGVFLLVNADPAATNQNQPQGWGAAQIPPQVPSSGSSGLDGFWQSSTGTALIIQGQQYQMFQNGQPADQGVLQVQGDMIIARSAVTGQMAQYRFAIQGNNMVTQNAYGQNFQWQRTSEAGAPGASQQGADLGSQPPSQMPGMNQPGGSMAAPSGPTASLSKELHDIIMRILRMESSYFDLICSDLGCSYFIHTFLEDGRCLYTEQHDAYAAQYYEDGSTAWSSSYSSKDAKRGRWSINNVTDAGDDFININLTIIWEDGRREDYPEARLDLSMPEYGPSLWLGKKHKLESVKYNMM